MKNPTTPDTYSMIRRATILAVSSQARLSEEPGRGATRAGIVLRLLDRSAIVCQSPHRRIAGTPFVVQPRVARVKARSAVFLEQNISQLPVTGTKYRPHGVQATARASSDQIESLSAIQSTDKDALSS